MYMRTFKNISFYILIAIPQFFFFIPYIVLADEWILESQTAKDTWGLEEQSPKYEWGLEDLTSKHEKSDSIILHYDGKTWNCIYNGYGVWLNGIYGFGATDIFAVGDQGVILHYDGTKWNKQKSNTNYLLLGIWGNKKDNLYVVGINSSSHYNHMLDVSYGRK
ncbi:hypothetical protein FJ364_05285 [Candidatus Dependentiae bacterium]|nr:hypothetical protein [Candidatus Dependentiae bacterium]